MSTEIVIWFVPASVWRLILPEVRVTECSRMKELFAIFWPRNFSSVKVSKAEFGGGGWLVV